MVVVAVALLLSVFPGLVAAANAASGLTPDRRCKNFLTGDGLHKLSVCSRGWNGNGVLRGVVEMHTYAWTPLPGNWVDSTSQSITLNDAHFFADYGADFGGTCRVDGPAGRVACSVPNTSRVAFYSPVRAIESSWNENWVWSVSWRDDRGIAHYVRSGYASSPDSLPMLFGWLI